MNANYENVDSDNLVIVESSWVNLKLGMLSMFSDLMHNRLSPEFPLFDMLLGF